MNARTRIVTRTSTSLTVLAGLVLGLTACGGGDPAGSSAGAPATLDGGKLFLTNCATCHGNTGKSDGLRSSSLPVRPRNLTAEPYRFVDIAGAAGSEVDALIAYINDGRQESGMPSFSELGEAKVRALAEFVASIRPRPNFVEQQPAGVATKPPAEQPAESPGEG